MGTKILQACAAIVRVSSFLTNDRIFVKNFHTIVDITTKLQYYIQLDQWVHFLSSLTNSMKHS